MSSILTITPAIIKDRLNTNFTQATRVGYWHFLAKTRLKETTYQDPKIEAMLIKLGPDSVHKAGPFGWCPLHVAAIAGNEAATRFFLSKGASPTEKDLDGNTPEFYCHLMNHPSILAILSPKSDEKSTTRSASKETKKSEDNDSAATLATIFTKRHVNISNQAFTYQAHTHDFGIEIKELLFSKPKAQEKGVPIDHFAKNMEIIAAREGFKLTLADYQYCVRDLLIPLPDGMILSPSTSINNIESALERARSKSLIEKSSAAYVTAHSYFHTHMGAGLIDLEKADREIERRFSHQNCLRFYMEGGNHYFVTSNKPKLIMGQDHLAIAVNQMRLDGIFNDPMINMARVQAGIEAGLTEATIRNTLQEMYGQGLLTNGKGLIRSQDLHQFREHLASSTPNFSSSSPSSWLDHAVTSGLYKPLDLSREAVLNSKKIAAEYLSQKEVTLEFMGRYFGIPKGDIHFIPQVGYHIDTFMRPGPKGSFFLQNYGFCIELLQTIKAQSKELKLSQADKNILERYLTTADQLHRELGPLLGQVEAELSKAGFKVIPTPGLFIDTSSNTYDNSSKCHINFLNAITGWSAKTKAFYYIASGASVGDHLGGVLMDAFTQFLTSYQKGMHVDFIGYDPANPTNFSQAMRCWNGPQAGPHCFSLELATKSYHHA